MRMCRVCPHVNTTPAVARLIYHIKRDRNLYKYSETRICAHTFVYGFMWSCALCERLSIWKLCNVTVFLSVSLAPTTFSSLGGLCDFEQSMCGWTHDPMSDLKWSLYSSSSPSLDLTLGSDSKFSLIEDLTWPNKNNLFKYYWKHKLWEFWGGIGKAYRKSRKAL